MKQKCRQINEQERANKDTHHTPNIPPHNLFLFAHAHFKPSSFTYLSFETKNIRQRSPTYSGMF